LVGDTVVATLGPCRSEFIREAASLTFRVNPFANKLAIYNSCTDQKTTRSAVRQPRSPSQPFANNLSTEPPTV